MVEVKPRAVAVNSVNHNEDAEEVHTYHSALREQHLYLADSIVSIV